MVGIALLAILLIGASAALVLRAVMLPRVRSARALDQIQDYGFMTADRVLIDDAPRPSIIEAVGRIVAPRLGKKQLAVVRRNLLGAGLHSTSVERYVGLYTISVLVIPLVLIWFAASTGATPGLAVFEVGIGLLIGILAPSSLLARRARLRLDKIDAAIPELVDLLLVGVEGGMGFNGAIRAASHRLDAPLGDELLLARCETPAIHSLVRTVVQGERLGVSIGQLMRTLAEEMRKRRKALAEELAGKIPIKILFPLVFFILPAMFIVLLTPAMANIITEFNGI
jgi:tight adherence protein C